MVTTFLLVLFQEQEIFPATPVPVSTLCALRGLLGKFRGLLSSITSSEVIGRAARIFDNLIGCTEITSSENSGF